jgi:DNA-binding MarR family transcriptional regulator
MNAPSLASSDESCLPVFRALIGCCRQVERVAARHVETLGLTHPQFDVLAELGDTAGMTVSELSERTLITRGTLKPVLDRLEERGLLVRCRGERDARQVQVALTAEGQRVFEATFGRHVAFLKQFIDRMPLDRQTHLIDLLQELERAFTP